MMRLQPSSNSPVVKDINVDGYLRQSGQAMVEALVAVIVMIAMITAIGWLFRWQDMALHAMHVSRALAFERVRNPQTGYVSNTLGQAFHGQMRWNDDRGQSLLHHGAVWQHIGEYPLLASGMSAMPPDASVLQRELGVNDQVIIKAAVTIRRDDANDALHSNVRGLHAGNHQTFEPQFMQLVRYTAILANAGHAADHLEAQRRIGQSALLWKRTADSSIKLGKHAASLMRPVDAPWRREAPMFDWLAPWAGRRPSHLETLQDWRRP